MTKKLLNLILVMLIACSCVTHVSATEAEALLISENPTAESSVKLTADTFDVTIDILSPYGEFVPSTMRFNLFTEDGEWLGNISKDINSAGRVEISFPVPVYEIGTKFKLVATTGLTYVNYCDTEYPLNDEITIETYAYRDNGELVISQGAHVTACPIYKVNTWEAKAEDHVNTKKIWSDTPYLIWVSKANFTVSVFLRENGEWKCIKHFPCSIGAPSTPTVTGQFKYYQYQKRWQYNGYYVGPIMRFYGGYAIHSTLVNNNGTDRDGRVGKMISHGCVRVRPENINWLTSYIPIGTKIYITNN